MCEELRDNMLHQANYLPLSDDEKHEIRTILEIPSEVDPQYDAETLVAELQKSMSHMTAKIDTSVCGLEFSTEEKLVDFIFLK